MKVGRIVAIVGGLLLLGLAAFLVLRFGTPAFVTATPRVVGTASSEKPNAGYLRVEVSSNFNAFSTADYAKVAKGFKYLSVGVTVSGVGAPNPMGQAPPEYPLLLLDLENRSMMLASNINVARGEYVNFESRMQPVLTFSIRAIPKTVASAYADAFQTLQNISTGIPLSQLADNNPYLSLAGRLLSNIANEANRANNLSYTTATIGLTGLSANTSPFPLDGTPTAIFLQPTDAPPPLPEPQTLKLCTNNPGSLCQLGNNAVETTYAALPYLIVRAFTTNFRPTSDWADLSWACNLGQHAEQVEHVERALHATRFTEEQGREELKMLKRVQVLVEAYALPSKLNLQQPDNLENFASILNGWRSVKTGDDNNPYWLEYYAKTVANFEECFQTEMTRRSQQHVTVFEVLNRAFDASIEFRKVAADFETRLTDENQAQLEKWLAQIKEPIYFLELNDGEVYGFLRAEQDSVERILLKSLQNQKLTEELTNTKTRNTARKKVNASLLSPCDSCRAELMVAVNRDIENNTKGAAPRQGKPAPETALNTERARKKWSDSRQRAEQMAKLASTLPAAVTAGVAKQIQRITDAENQVDAWSSDKAALDKARAELDDATQQLRKKLLSDE